MAIFHNWLLAKSDCSFMPSFLLSLDKLTKPKFACLEKPATSRSAIADRVLDVAVQRLPLEPGEPARIAGWSFRLVNVADP